MNFQQQLWRFYSFITACKQRNVYWTEIEWTLRNIQNVECNYFINHKIIKFIYGKLTFYWKSWFDLTVIEFADVRFKIETN